MNTQRAFVVLIIVFAVADAVRAVYHRGIEYGHEEARLECDTQAMQMRQECIRLGQECQERTEGCLPMPPLDCLEICESLDRAATDRE